MGMKIPKSRLAKSTPALPLNAKPEMSVNIVKSIGITSGTNQREYRNLCFPLVSKDTHLINEIALNLHVLLLIEFPGECRVGNGGIH